VREDGSPFPGEDHPAMVALRTGRPIADVVMGVAHGQTGERRWLSVSAVPGADVEGGPASRVYAVFTDLTEQRRTAALLEDRDRLLGRLRDANVLGILVADESRVIEANDAFLEMVGRTRQDLETGRVDWRAMTPPEWLASDGAALDQLRRSGSCRPFEKELLHADGHRVPILIGAAVSRREPLQWVTVIADLTDRQRAEDQRVALTAAAEAARQQSERAEERLQFLLRAGAMVASTGHRDELLRHATRLLVPTLADTAAVVLLDANGGARLASVEGVEGVGPAESGPTVRPEEGADYTAAAAKGSRIGGDGWPPPGSSLGRLAEALGCRSLVSVPIEVSDGPLGLLVLGRGGEREAFARADVQMAEELGRRLADGLATVDRFARDHSLAETLQRAVLPDRLPDLPLLDLAVRYLPATAGADVGGDWYDAFEIPGAPAGHPSVAVVVGDVVGHSVASASAMGQIRNALRAYAVDDPSPASVLARTNDAVVHLLPGVLATVFLGVLDLATGDLVHANAGHPPPVVIGADGVWLVDGASGVMLGVEAGAAYPIGRTHLAPGQAMLLYSDGLVEDRARPLDEGLAALVEMLRDARPRTAEEICAVVERALRGQREDDVCLLAITRAAP
jgi:PAS domain S-box-containing protein